MNFYLTKNLTININVFLSNTDNKIKKIINLHTNSERIHYWLFWVKKSKKISFVFFAQFPYDTNPFFVYQQIDSSTTNSNPNNCTDCLSLLKALRWTLYFVHGAFNLFFSYYSESTMQFFYNYPAEICNEICIIQS